MHWYVRKALTIWYLLPIACVREVCLRQLQSWGFPVIVKDGTARLLDESQSCGSILRLCEGLKNVFDWGIATAEEAVRMASEQPARSCGIDDVCGYIRPGYNADFIVLSKDLVLEETYLGGRSV